MNKKEILLRECLLELDREDIERDNIKFSFFENVDFSDEEMEQEYKKMVKDQKSLLKKVTATKARRVATVIVTLIIAAGITLVSVEATRDAITGFFVKMFNKYSQVTPTGDEEEKASIEQVYTLSVVPEGYELAESINDNLVSRQRYTNGDKYIKLGQTAAKDTHIIIDTEGAAEIELHIMDDRKAKYYETPQKRSIMWKHDGYLFELSSNELSKSELLELTKSVLPQE